MKTPNNTVKLPNIVRIGSREYAPEAVIDCRVTAKLFVSCTYSLMQGNPDEGNRQRVDHRGHGYATSAGIKRHYRDLLSSRGYPIHVIRGANLSQAVYDAASALNLDIVDVSSSSPKEDGERTAPKAAASKKPPKKGHALKLDSKEQIVERLTQFHDVRLFGGVITALNLPLTGAVQFSMGVTVDPVVLVEGPLTRVAVANEEELKSKDRTMGAFSVIQFGLFAYEISVSPKEARRSRMTWGDLHRMLELLPRVWDQSKSTTRSRVVTERLVVFLHSTELGEAQDARLCDAVSATLNGPGIPGSMGDYTISIDRSQVPDTIEIVDVAV